jgi:hypothetical protein
MTNHRIPHPVSAVVLILTILTLGGFLVFWLIDFIFPFSSTCTRCSSDNSFGPVGYADQRLSRKENQFAHEAEPPEK